MWQTRAARLAIALMALGSTAAACHHAGAAQASAADPQAADSVVGRVQLVGVAAVPRVALIPSDGGRTLTLSGPPALRNLDGLGVAVVGERSGSELHVTRFTVVAANGLAATDGRLVADGRTLYLETADRVRHPLVAPSPRLWEHVGGRAWVSGPLDREPVAYGIIE
jgi:hypothetical protein